MNVIQILRKVITNACVYNTFFILALYSAALLLPNGTGLIPKLEYMYMILLFSLSLSSANLLLRSKWANAAVRTVIHFICVAVIFYVIFIVWGGFANNGSMTLVVMLAFSAVYFIAVAIYHIIRKVNGAKESKESFEDNYQSQFSLSDTQGGKS